MALTDYEKKVLEQLEAELAAEHVGDDGGGENRG